MGKKRHILRLIKRPEPEILRQSWRPIITRGTLDNTITQVSQFEVSSVTISRLHRFNRKNWVVKKNVPRYVSHVHFRLQFHHFNIPSMKKFSMKIKQLSYSKNYNIKSRNEYKNKQLF